VKLAEAMTPTLGVLPKLTDEDGEAIDARVVFENLPSGPWVVRDPIGDTATALADMADMTVDWAVAEMGGEGLRSIDAALVAAGLDEQQRVIVLMRRMGHTWTEIGQRIGCHHGTALRRHAKAVKALNAGT
jgi:hypothetical protein